MGLGLHSVEIKVPTINPNLSHVNYKIENGSKSQNPNLEALIASNLHWPKFQPMKMLHMVLFSSFYNQTNC